MTLRANVLVWVLGMITAAGCTFDPSGVSFAAAAHDGGARTDASADASADGAAASVDGGPVDAQRIDAVPGASDAARAIDAAPPDAAPPDAAPPDAAPPDAAPPPPLFCNSADVTLRGCWRFETLTGFTFFDDESFYDALTTAALPTLEPGRVGMAARPALTAITPVDSGQFNATTSLTIEAFIRVDRLPTGSNRMGLFDAEGQYGLFLYSGGEVRCIGVPVGMVSGAALLGVGTFTHVACVYNGTTLRLYRDGVDVAATVAGPGTLNTGNTGVSIAGNVPSGEILDGLIDELRVFSSARTPAEIAAAAAR